MAERPVVIVHYEDLVNDSDLSEKLLEAWGPGGLGVVAVRGVPKWQELYKPVLKLSHSLAHLPAESLSKLEHEPSMYNAGWSHGKEKLGDKPDFGKGSFYFNPMDDNPGTDEDRDKFPWALPKNLWPAEELPDLEHRCKALGRTMHEVCSHLARLVDRTMRDRVEGYDANLGEVMGNTMKCKGRLLYYFPPAQAAEPAQGGEEHKEAEGEPKSEKVQEDGWIGWHNDSGFLTALTPDMYVDDDSGVALPTNPDPNGAGLWVVDRDGGSVHVTIPPDCMAVQVGECLQVITGGQLVATPHCVRGCRPCTTQGIRVARVSCPCFIDVHPDFPLTMPPGTTRENVLERGLSSKVPLLGDRWEHDGMSFGDFLGASFRRYYEWTLGKATKAHDSEEKQEENDTAELPNKDASDEPPKKCARVK